MGRYAPAFFSERCLIGAAKRGRSDAPRAVGERQKGEGRSGKAPPVLGAKESRDIEEIEKAGKNGGGHRDLDKEERRTSCRDIWEKGCSTGRREVAVVLATFTPTPY